MDRNRPLVAVDTLTYQFTSTSTPAIDAISFSIDSGEIIGVVGPDGAGKSTLLRLLAGLLNPTGGSSRLFDCESTRLTSALRKRVGYLPQRFGLYQELTVRQNLELYATLHRVENREKLFPELLHFSGLEPFQEREASGLSGGMKQKLGLICTLVGSPDLLLLDEPTAGVDPLSHRELWKMIEELNRKGMAVVWSTSDLSRVSQFNRVLLLNAGKLLHSGPPNTLTDRVKGRVYLLSCSAAKRPLLQQLAHHPMIVDLTLQGEKIRVVLKEGASPEEMIPSLPSNSQLTLTPPRFEDAFIDLLGGMARPYAIERSPEPTPQQESIPPIEARTLTKCFGSFCAVNHISFALHPGEIFGLLGPNGAGKSTTFKMLCGLLKPTDGEAFVQGESLLTAAHSARSKIGYMAQSFSLYNNLTVHQNLKFFGGLFAVRQLRNRIDQLVDTFNLAPYLDTLPSGLALGYKQRLALACVLLHRPRVLFLDEPTGGVDPLTRREFWTHMNALAAEGTTILVSTHLMDEAEFCDRIGFILQGKLEVVDRPDHLRQMAKTPSHPDPTLEETFLYLCERALRGDAS